MSDTLAERLRIVMREAGFNPDPAKRQGRAFARHCGLKSETQLNNVLAGRRGGIDEETARKIGRAVNASWYWLLRGGPRRRYEGDGAAPDAPERHVELNERYPSLADVIVAAEADGIPVAFVARVRAEAAAFKGADPGAPFWRRRFADLVRERDALRAEIKRPRTPAEEDTFGPEERRE